MVLQFIGYGGDGYDALKIAVACQDGLCRICVLGAEPRGIVRRLTPEDHLGMVSQGTFNDGRDHFNLVNVLRGVSSQGCGGNITECLFQVTERNGIFFGQVPQYVYRGDHPDV